MWLQLEYTSCRMGRHAGFQVRAATPDAEVRIGQDDMDEVIRLGLFRPPCTPEAPNPTAFRAVRLTSGRRVLQFSRYLGLDDTGREGNFRTRSLVQADEALSTPFPGWAMDLYHWPDWHTDLPASNTAELETPHHLPPVDIAHWLKTRADSPFSYPELSRFLLEDAHRPAWLAVMLASLFRPVQNRHTVVRDVAERNPLWLACITKLLPLPLAISLNISTFQHVPCGFDLVAVPPHCPVSREFLVEPCAAPPPEPPSGPGAAYARKAVDMLQHRPEAVPAFLQDVGTRIGRRK